MAVLSIRRFSIRPLFSGAVVLGLVQGSVVPSDTSVLLRKIGQVARHAEGRVSVACSLPGTALNCDLNANTPAPMQSVFKLPLAITVLHEIEHGLLSLDQPVRFQLQDRILPRTHSPLQDKYPDANVDVPLRELLRLAVAASDNVAADILLRLIGGPKAVSDYVASLGIVGFHLEDGEHGLHQDRRAQYRNWCTATAAVQLLRLIGDHSPVFEAHTKLLLEWMEGSARPRLKADLPVGTPVAHKAGTSGTEAGIAAATNDIGLITLPDCRRLAVAVFITDSTATEAARDRVIARIAREAYDAALQVTHWRRGAYSFLPPSGKSGLSRYVSALDAFAGHSVRRTCTRTPVQPTIQCVSSTSKSLDSQVELWGSQWCSMIMGGAMCRKLFAVHTSK